MSADDPDLPQAGATLGPSNFGPITQEQLARYAQASGDDNPLHLDPTLAVAAGLAAPPIHGVLMMSCFEPALRRWRPDLEIIRLSAKFLRPILVGGTIRVAGRVGRVEGGPDGAILMRLMAHGEKGELAVLAEAALRPRRRV